MKLIVTPHKIEIDKTPVNEKEIKVTEIQFEFKDIPSNYTKDVYFTLGNNTYQVADIQDNKCDIPYEVLENKGQVEIGVVAYLIENEAYVKRFNPSPVYISTLSGSLKDEYENYEEITPTDKEQLEQMLNNIELSVTKEGKITTISFTNTDGETQTETLEDGMGLDYDWQGTSLGVKREDESTYEYVNLKGDKGDPGAIKMIIVAELPATGQDDTIYLVPLATPESQENNYAEYVYINGNWELLGKIGIQVDLTDYYTKTETNSLLDTKQALIDSSHKLSSDLVDDTNKTNKFVTETDKTNWNDKISPTDYATTNKGGVIKINSYYNTGVSQNGNLISNVRTYQQYLNDDDYSFVSTKTLKNVLTGTIGNIDSVLDAINGEVI